MIDDWLLIHEFKEITKPKNCNKKKKTRRILKIHWNFLGWRKRVLKGFEPKYFQK